MKSSNILTTAISYEIFEHNLWMAQNCNLVSYDLNVKLIKPAGINLKIQRNLNTYFAGVFKFNKAKFCILDQK